MYVYEKQPLDVISAKLDLSRRTLFYWKKEYEWDKKRFEKGFARLSTLLRELADSYAKDAERIIEEQKQLRNLD